MTAALSTTGNERIAMGANSPPVFDAHKANVDDLAVEARDWLDGSTVTTAEEAEVVSTLMDMARKAKAAGDAARLEETKPHRALVTKINAAWETQIIGPASLILECCSKALTPYNVAEQAHKDAEIARRAEEAAAERQREVEATRAAGSDLSAREEADQLAASAAQAERALKAAVKDAKGKTGIRTTYTAEVTDFACAARHFWQPYHDRFEALVLTIAQEQVRAGKRQIPGITVHEEKKAI